MFSASIDRLLKKIRPDYFSMTIYESYKLCTTNIISHNIQVRSTEDWGYTKNSNNEMNRNSRNPITVPQRKRF